MDIGCTFPTPEHTAAFIRTCKQLNLHTIAFRGSVSDKEIAAFQQKVSEVMGGGCSSSLLVSLANGGGECSSNSGNNSSSAGNNLRCPNTTPIRVLKRADIKLSGASTDEVLASLAKKLTVTAQGSANTNQRSGRSEFAYEDCDVLVLHLQSENVSDNSPCAASTNSTRNNTGAAADPSILGNALFGTLLLASQNEVAKRRGPGSRLIVINLDCFVVTTKKERGNLLANGKRNNASQCSPFSFIPPTSSKAFALCKALAKCPDVVFELSYLPWIRGGGVDNNHNSAASTSAPLSSSSSALFSVPPEQMEAHRVAIEQYEDTLARMTMRFDEMANGSGSGNGGNNANAARQQQPFAPPPPPTAPVPVAVSLRAVASDIVAAFQKPLLLSIGQITITTTPLASATTTANDGGEEAGGGEGENDNDDINTTITNGPAATTRRNGTAGTIAPDLLLMRSPQDIYSLANIVMQLRRPLLEQGLAALRRLGKVKRYEQSLASMTAVEDEEEKKLTQTIEKEHKSVAVKRERED